ncbi:MAG: peptidylprolyl isomerase [Collinsella sp.]|nr:peptidylprolyl isomerase [Collinsella sp.]
MITKNMKVKREDKEADAPTKAERKKATRDKLTKGGKIALVVVGCAAMFLSVSAMACSGIINAGRNQQTYELTGGVAATVNGTNITEDTVTKQIMGYRTSAGYTEDEDWAQFLVDQGQTPESYRENIIQGIARDFLVDSAVKDYDITVSNEDVEKEFEKSAQSYGGRDGFVSFLKSIGYTEQSYKDTLRSTIAKDKLREKVSEVEEPSDQDIVDYLNENLDTFNDARRSSNLLVKVAEDASDEDKQKARDKAQEALDKINSGELSFEQAVEEYSDDTASKENGGDVGWDKLTSFVPEYQDALTQLSKDQVSGIVETAYGYHIILCTDVFKLDGPATSVDQLPKEVHDYIENVVSTKEQSAAYDAWLTEYTEKADIVINKMPDNVPYNVSLKGVEPSTTEDATE